MKNLIDFFTLAEKLECEYRSTRMSDGTQQSVASHSWNMVMMAIVLPDGPLDTVISSPDRQVILLTI